MRPAILSSLGIILGALIVHGGLIYLGIWGKSKESRNGNETAGNFYISQALIKSLWRIFLLVSPLFLWISGLLYICSLFPQARSRVYQVRMFLGEPIFSLGQKSYSALQLLLLIA